MLQIDKDSDIVKCGEGFLQHIVKGGGSWTVLRRKKGSDLLTVGLGLLKELRVGCSCCVILFST